MLRQVATQAKALEQALGQVEQCKALIARLERKTRSTVPVEEAASRPAAPTEKRAAEPAMTTTAGGEDETGRLRAEIEQLKSDTVPVAKYREVVRKYQQLRQASQDPSVAGSAAATAAARDQQTIMVLRTDNDRLKLAARQERETSDKVVVVSVFGVACGSLGLVCSRNASWSGLVVTWRAYNSSRPRDQPRAAPM
jgi:hypothetical protein